VQTKFNAKGDSGPARVLAFGAHPDDLEIGAGGLLARLVQEGAEVLMVVTSVPTLSDLRVPEAARAARHIGAEHIVLYKERMCRVEDIPMNELVACYDSIVADFRPSLVLTHSDKDLHWDHGLVNRATISAMRRTPCDMLAYVCSPEMNALARAFGQFYADITTTINKKMDAIRAHESQLPKITVESSRDLARALGRLCGVAFAECYEVMRMVA